MTHPTSDYLLTDTSLLKSVQYKIDKEQTLTITTVSPYQSSIDLVPLDMINPEPKLEKIADKYLIALGLILVIMTISVNSLTQYIDPSFSVILNVVLLALTVITLVLMFENKKEVATFYFVNTKTKLFSIVVSQSNTEDTHPLNDTKRFVSILTKIIKGINQQDTNAKTVSFSKMTMAELFNYGVIDEFLYTRIENRINDFVNSTSENNGSSNIIPFRATTNEKPEVDLAS